MSIFSEKYKPSVIDDVIHNRKLITMLTKILNNKKNIPNILIYGPNGSGKQTIVRLLLKKLYNN